MLFRNHAENEEGRLVSDFSLFVKKALYKVKASGHHLSFNLFWETSLWTYNKNKLYNISDCLCRDMLNFDFLE